MDVEKNVISLSGGKDSTALLLHALEKETENIVPVFADTGNEHKLTYDYLEYLERILNIKIIRVKAVFNQQIAKKREYIKHFWIQEDIPQQIIEDALSVLEPTGVPFLDLCLWKGRFPSTMAAFCSTALKRNPIMQEVQEPFLQNGNDVISWQGVRAQESKRRALLQIMEHKLTHSNGAELWNYRPLLNWSVKDVFAIHKKHNIEPNPLYSQGMARVGCMPCINCRKDELL